MYSDHLDKSKNKKSKAQNYFDKANQLASQLEQNMSQGFNYNPSSDPNYQNALAQSTRNVEKASSRTMEQMNDRGILNSTVTSDRVGQQRQDAMQNVNSMIPQLSNQSYGRYQDNLANQNDLLQTMLGAGFNQQNFNRDTTLQDREYAMGQAELTGNYVPSEARGTISEILKNKRYMDSGKFEEGSQIYNQLENKNDTKMEQLASMGLDINNLNLSSYSDALGGMGNFNKTLESEKLDWGRSMDQANQTGEFNDPRASGLIDQLLNLKRTAESSGGTDEITNRADSLRSQLSSMGVEANDLFGSGVTYEQALQNAQNTGTETLGSKQFKEDTRLSDRKLDVAEDELRFKNTELAMNDDLKRDLASIDAQLKREGYDIRNSELMVNKWKEDNRLEEEEAEQISKETTNAVIGSLSGLSPEEATKVMNDNVSTWVNNGVNMEDVIKNTPLRNVLYGDSGSSGSMTAEDAQNMIK